MTSVSFECATIRDVIGKAARIAPTSGSAFDRASGILIEIDVPRNEVVVRSTNTEVFYMEITDAVSMEGESATWRIPSIVLDGICSKLPISSGSSVDFEQNGNVLKIKQKRMVANIRLMDPTYFPTWEAFDSSTLTPVSGFGGRLQQVQWAASKAGTPPLTGINLNGEYAGATDNHRVAITPCTIEGMTEPVTIPAATFTPLMKSLGEVMIGRDQYQLLVMPDEATQIRAVIYDLKYPPLVRVFTRQEAHAVMVNRDNLLEIIEQAMVMGQRDRTPLLKFIIGMEEIAVLMEDQEMGLLGNVLDVPAQALHDRQYIGLTPDNITAALKAAPNNDIAIYYDLVESNVQKAKKPLRIDGGSGYEVLIMPRNLDKGAEE